MPALAFRTRRLGLEVETFPHAIFARAGRWEAMVKREDGPWRWGVDRSRDGERIVDAGSLRIEVTAPARRKRTCGR